MNVIVEQPSRERIKYLTEKAQEILRINNADPCEVYAVAMELAKVTVKFLRFDSPFDLREV